jgi:hypothetical protein
VRDISSRPSACTAIFTAVLIFVGGVSAYDGTSSSERET